MCGDVLHSNIIVTQQKLKMDVEVLSDILRDLDGVQVTIGIGIVVTYPVVNMHVGNNRNRNRSYLPLPTLCTHIDTTCM